MMIKQFLISVLSILFLFSCSNQMKKTDAQITTSKTSDNINENESQTQQIFKLNEGETRFLKNEEMNLTFVKVVEDSRCPKDVNCIWSGVGVVELKIMGTYTRPSTIKISTIDDAEKGYSKSAIFNGFKISLQELNPYPKNSTSKEENIGKHTIALQILKTTENEIEPGTR